MRRMLLLALSAVLVVTAAAAGAAELMLRGRQEPVHRLVIPAAFGPYVRKPALEKQMDGTGLRREVIAKGSGQASHVVYAVYENASALTSGGNPEIILFIGGNLSGVSSDGFISSFTQQFKGAQSISSGPMGGKAACVSARPGVPGGVALCAWADNDTFGVVASSTMASSDLADQLRAIRPSVERPAK